MTVAHASELRVLPGDELQIILKDEGKVVQPADARSN
jgi:hypothetical protein